ncbi:hypothetical protein [Caldisericum sp.]|uniref:hypothetical protein n=1 Tax=Caldisericum sp. TaxID=2499687 RepID=UPI003D142B9E
MVSEKENIYIEMIQKTIDSYVVNNLNRRDMIYIYDLFKKKHGYFDLQLSELYTVANKPSTIKMLDLKGIDIKTYRNIINKIIREILIELNRRVRSLRQKYPRKKIMEMEL